MAVQIPLIIICLGVIVAAIALRLDEYVYRRARRREEDDIVRRFEARKAAAFKEGAAYYNGPCDQFMRLDGTVVEEKAQ